MNRARPPVDRIGLGLATLFGAGRAPVVPGTVGTLAALPAVVASGLWLPVWGYAALTAAITLAAVWSAGVAARVIGADDPGAVVIDEAAGLYVTLLGIPVAAGTVLGGFILFRAFDVLKPEPARRAERLPGGTGIVLDDLIAGAYANVALRAALFLYHRLAS